MFYHMMTVLKKTFWNNFRTQIYYMAKVKE